MFLGKRSRALKQRFQRLRTPRAHRRPLRQVFAEGAASEFGLGDAKLPGPILEDLILPLSNVELLSNHVIRHIHFSSYVRRLEGVSLLTAMLSGKSVATLQ